MFLNLRAILTNYEPRWKRATLLLLDEDAEPFTYQYLKKKYDPDIYNPVDFSRSEFYVKIHINKVKCYSTHNKHSRIPLEDLIDQYVEIVVKPNIFDYKNRRGWTLTLYEIYPVHRTSHLFHGK